MCSGITVQIKNTTLPLCSPISSNLTMLNLMLCKKQSMLFYLTICKFSCEIRKSSQSDTRCYMTTLSWLKNCATLHDTFFAGLLIHSIENGGTIVQCWFIHICEFIRQIIVSRINNRLFTLHFQFHFKIVWQRFLWKNVQYMCIYWIVQ
jgi:hypothetical protein